MSATTSMNIPKGFAQLPADFLPAYRRLQIVNAIGYAILALVCTSLIVHLRRHRATAYSGDDGATRKLILPSFEPLLRTIAITSLVLGLYFTVVAIVNFTGALGSGVALQALFQGRQALNHFIVLFFSQRSVSKRALRRAGAIALGLMTPPLAMATAFTFLDTPSTTRYIAQSIYSGLLAFGYVYIAIFPLSRASPRVWREFAGFVLVYYIALGIQSYLFFRDNMGVGATFLVVMLVWDTLLPYFLWRLLRADTEHWRGLGQRAVSLTRERTTTVLHEAVSSEGLHVLLELHEHHVVDFAHLKVDDCIGGGLASTVHRGTLFAKWPVAIKVFTPPEISQAAVLEFSHEAALWAALQHPNIVAFYGICVSPPAICFVSELCVGTLSDVLSAPPPLYLEPLWPQLCLMLDAARAVAYLHSFTPPFLHRDLKPSSFLVGEEHVLKLSDFGDARSVATRERSMTVRGTFDYMAPEVIDGAQGRASYDDRADVFSLAITLWDICHPGRDKYPLGHHNHFRVFELVLDGHRPPLDANLHPALADLLESAWCPSPLYRISAATIVSRLEQLQAALSEAVLAPQLCATPVVEVTGDALVRRVLDGPYAFSAAEATRLCNGLMDGGVLHHYVHKKPFYNTHSSVYVLSTRSLTDLCSSETTTVVCDCKRLAQGKHKRLATKAPHLWRPWRSWRSPSPLRTRLLSRDSTSILQDDSQTTRSVILGV
ncbi:TKL protein kinase [Saprolegnia diclina VS20]|uniref:TKL protein kinase n=1 Tax=Saprolegnia diclina (strain VS20) TaxID=1156394 RepID=T0RRV7_SAPDV|nr:TKL protein kinase [Saprolegnia diclina VS20]EQC32887.1 TKL protein kinase [Saprolegnia diclina VS20]|eukprot:XP_008613573.1 TKL protein kinase [Saprolegnia diclina VS20]